MSLQTVIIIIVVVCLLGALLGIRSSIRSMQAGRRLADWPQRRKRMAAGRRSFSLALLMLLLAVVLPLLVRPTAYLFFPALRPTVAATKSPTPGLEPTLPLLTPTNPTSTAAGTQSPTASLLPTRTTTRSLTPTLTLEPADTRWPTRTATLRTTASPSRTASPLPTRTMTLTRLPSLTPEPSDTRWPTRTTTGSIRTATMTPSSTLIPKPSDTRWPTKTVSPTPTASRTNTLTPDWSPTLTTSRTSTPTSSSTPLPSDTRTATSTSTPLVVTRYDLQASACAAEWSSGAGVLPCPGSDADPRGFVLVLVDSAPGDGTLAALPGLLTQPQQVDNGYIRGVYPEFLVQDGDRFQASLGCEQDAATCSVLFRLEYQVRSASFQPLWSTIKAQDGRSLLADIDLSLLAGRKIAFTLSVFSLGSASGDRAIWGNPRILRALSPAP